MQAMRYEDFDLLIEPFGNRYKARVLNSPVGPAKAEFRLRFRKAELEQLAQTLDEYRRYGRPLHTLQEPPALEVVKGFGRKLFQAVFQDEVAECLRRSLDLIKQRKAGLRLRLRLTETPDLANIPWEYLYYPARNDFLGLSTETPIVRYLDLREQIPSLAVQPPIRILVMLSSPIERPLNVEHEWESLRAALGDLEKRGLVVLERLPEATLKALQAHLGGQKYHIFHFIGHGVFEERTKKYGLVLDGEKQPVSAQQLSTILHDERTLRLAVLNACETGRHSRTDAFAGTAQTLMEQNLPAVVAMQFAITDEAAITFAHEFYRRVAEHCPVDAAVTEARRAIFAQPNEVEWGTPVLYMRSPDGVIFDFSAEEAAVDFKKPRQEKKRFSPAVPDNFAFLTANRKDQDEALESAIQDWQKHKPRRPFFCIVHGDLREGHLEYLQRLQEKSLPQLLKQRPEVKMLEWPFNSRKRENRAEQLRRRLAPLFQAPVSTLEISKIISRTAIPTMLHTLFLTENWPHFGSDSILDLIKFWNEEWPDLPPRQFLIVCLCIKYQNGEGIWARPQFKWRNQAIKSFLSKLDFVAYGNVYGVVLPELCAIPRLDVENWVHQHAPEHCPRHKLHKLMSKVDALYRTPELRISMNQLGDRLYKFIEEVRSEKEF